MKATILIPTYRRTQDLSRCLEAVSKQSRPADEVILVVRGIDTETWKFLESYDNSQIHLSVATVTVPGQVAALNCGLDQASGSFIAITDDDAAPHPDWLANIETHFKADSTIGGVGGRDWMYVNNQLQDASSHPGASQKVGIVEWSGRMVGNHHIGVGAPREVDLLKGANMSYRTKAIENLRFDQRLLGKGAQVHNDAAFSLAVKRQGWKLIYDPAVAVNHYLAQRFDNDQRDSVDNVKLTERAHNETLILLNHLSVLRRFIFLIWAFLVGTRTYPGCVQWLRFLPSEKGSIGKKLFAVMEGRLLGLRTWKIHKITLSS